jgi:hypothetical protein
MVRFLRWQYTALGKRQIQKSIPEKAIKALCDRMIGTTACYALKIEALFPAFGFPGFEVIDVCISNRHTRDAFV